jgi:hypothetical protein
MKTLKKLFKYTFISAPKTMVEMVEFNSARIGVLTVLIMIIMVFMAIFGKLPTWSFLK